MRKSKKKLFIACALLILYLILKIIVLKTTNLKDFWLPDELLFQLLIKH